MTARFALASPSYHAELPRGGWGGAVRVLVVAITLLLAVSSDAFARPVALLMAETEARYHELLEQTQRISAPDPEVERNAAVEVLRSATVPNLVKVDLRVALLKLAREGEADARAIVLSAQAEHGAVALSLTDGVITLPELLAEAQRAYPGTVDDGRLGIPLIVEEGAALVLDKGAVLILNRERGAFLVNFGRLDIRGGGIIGAGGRNKAAPSFAPFVATAGRGVMTAHGAYFANLGFGADLAFGGLSVVVNSFFQGEVASALTGSVLRAVGSTIFVGGAGVEIMGNRFIDPQRTALILRATHTARILRNTFIDGAAGDAIRIAPNAMGTDIRENEIFNPRESGIALLPGSAGTTIRDVTVWRPRHNGIQAERSDCVNISGARIFGARQEGIALRASRGVILADSVVIASKRAGLLVADLPGDAVTQVSRNRFAVNRIGIQTAAPGRLDLKGNDFRDQFPRFLAGDVQFMTPDLLRDLTGKARIVLAGGGAPVPLTKAPPCPAIQEH